MDCEASSMNVDSVDGNSVPDTLVNDDSVGFNFVDSTSDSDDALVDCFVASSSDENNGSIMLAEYLNKNEYKGGKLKIGHIFKDVDHFRTVLNDLLVAKGFSIVRKYSEPRRFVAKCKEEGCTWYIYAARLNRDSGFIVRQYNKKHSCRLTEKSVHVTAPWIAEKIKGQITVDKNCKVKTLLQYMQETYMLKIKPKSMYRARERARELVYGSHDKGYEKLYAYAEAILKSNPGALCKVMCDTYNYIDRALFQRFMYAFPASRNAYLSGCRPFFGIDGCHLKGRYGGVLLTAVGIDGNNCMVPLAICVCEKENLDTWGWFLKYLHNYLDDGRRVTIMSDRQKGLVNVVKNIWPTATHRPCCRHIYANFTKKYSGSKLRILFWKAAKSSNKTDHDMTMAAIRDVNEGAYKWLIDLTAEFNWALFSYDTHCKVERTDNNVSESFNSWILPSREKPCMLMLEEIRCQLMILFTERQKEVNEWTRTILPKIFKAMTTRNIEGMKMQVQPSGEFNFEVNDRSSAKPRRFIVKLNLRTCDCGWWDVSELPCAHGLACINAARHEIEEYIPVCYSKEACIQAYSVMVHPWPDECTWEPTDTPLLYPPKVSSKIGRPKKKRTRAVDEPKRVVKRFMHFCNKCGAPNHNSRTCKNNSNVRGESSSQPSNLPTQSSQNVSKSKAL